MKQKFHKIAWKLLCKDTAYGLHQYDNWDQVPQNVQQIYLKKAEI